MGLFGKKKKDAAKPPEKKEEPEPDVDEDGKPIKPEYLRASRVELGDVETAIDIKTRQESRSNILKMYEEKYGEKLDAPEFSAGLQYEYQLYEEGTYKTKRDIKDIEKGTTPTEGAKPVEGATPTEGTKPVEGAKPVGDVQGAATKPEDKPKDKPKETPVVPGESFFDPDKPIDWQKSGLMCIGLGKPFFPIQRYFRYKARHPKGWMLLLFILDLWEFPSWLWRLPARGIYEAWRYNKKVKAKKAEEEAKAKAERKAKKAAKRVSETKKASRVSY